MPKVIVFVGMIKKTTTLDCAIYHYIKRYAITAKSSREFTRGFTGCLHSGQPKAGLCPCQIL